MVMLDRIYWVVPDRAIVIEVIGEVMLQDVRELIDTIRKTIDANDHSDYVDVMLDVTRVTSYHPETMNIRKLFGAVKRHERVRWNIIISPNPNPVFDFVIRTVTQLFRTQLVIIPSLDEAVAFVQSKTAPGQS
jgi:hypothetical protein